MNDLEKLITKANEAYRQGNPIMSDPEYDALLDKLADIKPDSELLTVGVLEDVPTERKQRLPMPMYSLNKCANEYELLRWLNGHSGTDELVITAKYDGISLCVNESNGNAWTRGNGTIGQRSDVHYARTAHKRKGIKRQTNLMTFGEAIMLRAVFESRYSDTFSNARNLVAGLFNAKEIQAPLRDVLFVRYGTTQVGMDKDKQLEMLNDLNVMTVPNVLTSVGAVRKLSEKGGLADFLDSVYQAFGEVFTIDGLVIEFNSYEKRKQMGRETNMNPAYARAIKFPHWSATNTAKVTGLTLRVSKQGKVKPVINIEPTDFEGVTVRRATGYNMRYIIDNHIAQGSVIELTRSGDVIPKHLRTISWDEDLFRNKLRDYKYCPSCGSRLRWDTTNTELICDEDRCREKQIGKLDHFFKVVGIEGFRRKSIENVYDAGFKTIGSIVTIQQHHLATLPGWGWGSAAKVIDEFDRVLFRKGVTLAKMLHALDVFDGVLGEKMAQKIIDALPDEEVEMLINEGGMSDNDILYAIEGVGYEVASAFLNGMYLFKYHWDLGDVKVEGIKTPKAKKKKGKWLGQAVCFTGVRSKELEQEITDGGGTVCSGVSKKTTLLIVKDLSEKVLSSNKARKAEELGIEIKPITDF